MDTPEGDVFVIQSSTMEPLPLYVEQESEISGLQALVAALPSSPLFHPSPLDRDTVNAFVESQAQIDAGLKKDEAPEPIKSYPGVLYNKPVDELMRVRQAIVTGFFNAISKGQDEDIALFINNNLVTANTTDATGKTPLLAAMATRNVRVVQALLDFGADPDAFGVESYVGHHLPGRGTAINRTPLQLAASIGHLPLVKLLMEVYHCDDSLIAPDGQIALRLAAENGHREIVAYLPARRGGGFRRWQHHHQKAIQRTKMALEKIYRVLKFFLWDIEKFLLWSVPKHLVFKPLAKGCAWCWKHKKGFLPWCAFQLGQMPDRAKRFGKWFWTEVKAVPKAAVDTGKAIWKFGTVTLPRGLKKLALWIWSLFTTRIPEAIAIVAKWIWAGLTSMGRAVLDVLLKAASLLHTVLEAVLTFFRDLTLKDLWNGLCSLLRTIFVTFPRTIWSWVLDFSETSFMVMKTAFGNLGDITWWIVYGIGWLALYVPRKFWVILQSLGGSFAKAWYEVMVFVRPKA